jgi:hypothetical protein
MDAKTLAAKIREHRRAVIRGEGAKPKPKDQERPQKPHVSRMYPLGPALCEDRRQWVQVADERPERLTPKTKRTAKPSPLVEIAKKWRRFASVTPVEGPR